MLPEDFSFRHILFMTADERFSPIFPRKLMHPNFFLSKLCNIALRGHLSNS